MIESNIWKPTESVGSIIFGSREEDLSTHELRRIHEEEITSVNWSVYGSKCNSIRVYCEDGVVASIAAYKCLYFNSVNLIGSALEKVKALFPEDHFSEETAFELSGRLQTPWSCDALGVTLWVNTKNFVVSCSCDDGK